MKGIVIEINNKDAVILSDDGLFKKIGNRNYEIGQTLQINESKKNSLKEIALKPVVRSKLITGAARIAAVLAIGTTGAFAWYTPTDYISMDVNPSIEYSVNMFDRILDVHAVNEDGEEILSNLDLKNKNIGEGLRETLDELIAEGYLAGDPDSGVVIATSNDRQTEAEKMASELKQEVQTYLKAKEDVTVKVDAGAASPEKVQEAKSMGVTPGKLHLVEKLQASTTGAIEMEQWLTKPVKDINKEIKKNRETASWNPYDAAQPAYSPYWNRNQDGDGDQSRNWSWDQSQNWSWDQDQIWNWDQDQNWNKNWSQSGAAGAENDGKSKGGNNGSGDRDQGTYQTWNWDQDQTQSRDQENNQDKNLTPGQTKTTAPAMNLYQTWDWTQYWAQPGGSGSGAGKSNKDSKDNRDNKDSENFDREDFDREQSRNQNWSQDWSQNWSQPANKNQSWNWSQPVNKNQNQGQGQNQDQSQNKNQGQGQNQDQSQNKNQSQNESWSQNRNQNWSQPEGRNQTTPGGVGNGSYGGWYGDWGKSDSRDNNDKDGDDKDAENRSGGKDKKSRNND